MSELMQTFNQSLGSIPYFDFLNLGIQPFFLAIIYLLIIALLIVGVVLLLKNKKGKNPSKKLLEKWSKTMPEPESLMQAWGKLSPENQGQVGLLSKNQNWLSQYLKAIAKNEAAYNSFLTLWPYQEEQQDDLLLQLNTELASLDSGYCLAVAGLIKELKDKRIMSYLLADLLGAENYSPSRVCECLAVFGSDSGEALAYLYHKVDTPKRLLILDALGVLAKFCPHHILQTAMGDPEFEIRKKTAQIIAEVKPPQPVEFMAPLINDANPQVRAATAKSLGEIGGEDAVLTIRKIFATDSDWLVKATCQTFLSHWENEIQTNLSVDEADLWLK